MAHQIDGSIKRAPSKKPPFTLSDLKKAIPPHCFHRSLLRSFAYLFFDLTLSFFFYYVAAHCIPLLPADPSFRYVAWPVYWLLQGCVLLGAWIIGHDCGHHAFSEHAWLNDTVGFLLHTLMLAPYFSWKFSHSRHHSHTASLEHDESFVPRSKSSSQTSFSKLLNTPPGRLFRLVILCTVGWHLYVWFNVSGKNYKKFANHFDPLSPIFRDRERLRIFITDIGLVATCYGVYRLVLTYGFSWIFCIYLAPLVVVYAFLAVITWLHHTHRSLPHYDSREWDWLRGALSTIDRDYGILNWVLNHITDTHVAHHLFTTIPHYHALEATRAIKPVLGEYYQYDDTPIIKAMWREATECFFVETDEINNNGVFWFNNNL